MTDRFYTEAAGTAMVCVPMDTMFPHLIGIAGPSGAGKTTLATALSRSLGDTVPVVPLDAYYRDAGPMGREGTGRNYDHPAAIDHELLGQHLEMLASGHPIDRPCYDFCTHTRLSETVRVQPAAFVVVEGLLAFYWSRTRELLDTRIFLRTADALCLSRRMARDTRERNRTEASVHHQWTSTVRPMFEQHVEPTAAFAHAEYRGDQPVTATVEHLVRRFGW